MAIIDLRGATLSAADPPIATNPNPDLAWKAPVRAATAGSNITLSGLQTIDAISLNAGDRVLVKDQTDQTTNGLYNAATGPWTRTIDAANNSQWARGLQVLVTDGAANAITTWECTATSPIILGTSLLPFIGPAFYRAANFGIIADGVTDQSSAMNTAITAISNAGGGNLILPAGTIIAQGIVMRSFVTLQGQGRDATIIKGKSGTTGPIITTLNYATLVGTNTPAGPFKWGITDLTIDGNSANRASGDNLDLYGYDFILDTVDIRNAPGGGIYSEWSTSPAVPVVAGGDGMEAHVTNVRVFSNGANGIVWNGPHDSQFVNILSYINTAQGINFGISANYSAVACQLTNVHSYGNGTWGIVTDTNIFGTDVESETNGSGGIQVNSSGQLDAAYVIVFNNAGPGIQLNSNSSTIVGISTDGNTGASGDGIQINANDNTLIGVNSSGNAQSGVNIGGAGNIVVGQTLSNTSGLNFTNSIGSNIVNVVNFQSSGDVFVGNTAPQPGDTIDVVSSGVALQYHQHHGTSTNDAAQAGNIGELISNSVGQGSPVILTNATPVNITSISLTAGDWDVSANFYVIPDVSTSISAILSSISSTTGSMNLTNGFNVQHAGAAYTPGAASTGGYGIGPARVSLAATTTYYLVGQCNFTTSTAGGFGTIRARRVR